MTHNLSQKVDYVNLTILTLRKEYRYCAIYAILRAWKTVVDGDLAKKAFRTTGMRPFNAGVMLQGRGVNFISSVDPEKEARRDKTKLFITSERLNYPDMIEYIRTMQQTKEEKKDSQAKMLTEIKI